MKTIQVGQMNGGSIHRDDHFQRIRVYAHVRLDSGCMRLRGVLKIISQAQNKTQLLEVLRSKARTDNKSANEVEDS